MEAWKPKVGDVVYAVFDCGINRNGFASITKVGREYAYLDTNVKVRLSDRVILRTVRNYSGHVFENEEQYVKYKELRLKRNAVREHIAHLTDEQVETVYGWLEKAGVLGRFECHVNLNKNFN